MRPAIAGVMHDTSGPAVRVNGHGQGELITPLRLIVAGPGPGWRCEVERNACRRDFLKPDTREVCQLYKKAAIARQYRCELGRRRVNG